MGVLKFGNEFWGGEIRALSAEFLLYLLDEDNQEWYICAQS